MTAHFIRLKTDEDGIFVLTVHRAEKCNAVTYAMLAAFTEKRPAQFTGT